MKTKFQLPKRLLSIILCFAMVLSCLPIVSMMAFAAEGNGYQGGAGIKVSDLDTSTLYSLSLGDNASTEYAGRIWTDKSVYSNDVTFATYGGGQSTIKLNEGKNGEDFLIAYSALATSESVSGSTQAPVDVVFIIDTSGSMTDAMSSTDSTRRIVNTVNALNDAIEEIMGLNDYTRVGVVAFADESEELLPLGRYEKGTRGNGANAVTDFFSLSNNNGTLYVHAKREGTNQTVTDERSVTGGTNIQRGIYAGMNMLATEDDTTANINGSTLQRVPSVVLLSDGAPTYSSDSSSWWAPGNNNNDGPGGSPYYGNGMKALMTGSFMKEAVNRNYGVTGTKMETTMYTIGMGIKGLSNTESVWGYQYYTGEQDLANITLNPKAHWEASNSMAQSIVSAWSTYITNNGTPSVQTNSNETYRFTHPTGTNAQYDIDTDRDALKNLVDDYYDADNASAVTSVFNEIVANIAISAPQVPTEIKGSDPMTDGYITYTDLIGDYMEVKDVKAIIYAGQTFTAKNVSTAGNVTTYTFAGEVHSPVYGDQEIKNIVITVTETDGKQTLVVKIPAAVIPLRVNEVTLNADGSVKTHTNNGAFPARVIYSVGLQSEVVKQTNNGDAYVDRTKISPEYLAAHTNTDGTVNFYSNEYTNPHLINGFTVGDTTVEFEPSHTNGFYYILEDMPIYKDAQFKNQVTAAEGLDDDTTYYYRDEYYHGNAVEVDAVERTGTQLKRTEIKTGADGYLYRVAGSPRLNRILKFEGTKTYNRTNTAQDFYAPEFHYAEGSTDAYDGKFIVHLGNNGLLSMIAGGNLQISKTVNAGLGLTAPDKTFEFTVELDGNQVNNGTYDYVIVNREGQPVGNGTISASNKVLSLKDGQTATVFSLPPETEYTVTEAAEAGFVTESQGTTGTIAAGETRVADFTNTYQVTPVTFPSNGTLSGQKTLAGREWTANDSFTFFITPYNNAPLPANYDAAAGVTVNGPDQANGQKATFDFGTIEFTAPGVYRYTIVEKEPDNDAYLPGMTYSRALYRLVVTVVDNGNGTLSVTESDIQKLYDDGAAPLFTYTNGELVVNDNTQDAIQFTNTYSVDQVVRVPVALKDYTDNSGQNPLVSGMFEFKLEAIGVVENGAVVENSVSKVPMPQGSVNGAITTENEGHNVTFPAVTFTQDMIPDNASSITFRYQMSEVVPATPVNGMSYDDTVYTVDVVVSVDANSHILNVSPIYPNDERIVTFRNEYTPNPVSAHINGNKTLNGRDMKDGESFEFNLAGYDAATNNAVRNGAVVVPSSTATVTGAKNGVASSFAFENIQFNKAGTYRFVVTETQGSAPSVEYDRRQVVVTVVIDDVNKDGDLDVVSVTYADGRPAAEFTNTYTSRFSGTPVSLSGTKNLTGKSLLAGEFYFVIQERFNGTQVNNRFVTHTADASADAQGVYTGQITFLDNVSYDAAGTYEYYITEYIPQNKVGGTTYDESQFRYTVIVEDDWNGNLRVASATLEKLNGSAWETAAAVAFNNTYVPTPTTAVLPLINKVIDGNRSEELKQGEFEFEMKVVSANPADGIILPSVTTVGNGANGNILFDAITFTKGGTYVVSVQEIVPDEGDKVAGITYSEQVITAVFTVYDNRIGELTATLTDLTGGENITNFYNADPADVTIDITKTFTGREDDQWLTTDKFDFEVKAADAATLAAITNGDIEFTLDNESVDRATYTIAAKGDKATAAVKVNKPGTYKFVVSEIDGQIPGVSYDGSEKEVVIVATDDSANAQIKVTVNGQDSNKATLNFANEYRPDATDLFSLSAKKKVTASEGNSFTLKGGEFSFVIEGTQGAPLPADTTAENDADGNVNFGTVAFTKRGTYAYTIREVQADLGGFTYDGEVYTVTVKVTDDYANGKLVIETPKITNKANEDAAVEFDNKYNPKETSAILFGAKELKGGHKQLEADAFEFSLKAKTQGAPLPADTTVKNTATGTFQFDAITYTKVGTYEYEIRETDLNQYGYTYDDTVYTVTVTVTDEGNGLLQAKAEGVGTPEAPAVKFVNEYAPDPVTVVLGANSELLKKLEGRELNAEEFIFTVLDGENAEVATAKNDKNGNFTFALNFTKAGTYRYTIAEKNNAVAGVTYDKTVYGVQIVISDKDGRLAADGVVYTLDGDEADEVVFSNAYEAENTHITISAIKNLIGRDLKDGEFKFVLKDNDGNVVATATNTKDGAIVFDKIVLTEAGVYTYTVFEETGTLQHVTYDKTEYVVEVKVVDEGKGKLAASAPVIKKAGSNDALTEIVFENVYAVPAPPQAPVTGDSTPLGLWLALFIVSGLGLIGTTLHGKKKKAQKAN